MTQLARFGSRLGDHLRAVIVASLDTDGPELLGFALYHDAKRQFCSAYGRRQAGGFIRPDGYIGWRGRSCFKQNLTSYLQQVFSH
jgi:hypothetical protein